MSHNINPEVRETGYLIKESINQWVAQGEPVRELLGYHHDASQWVDLDHEDAPMDTDTQWYLATDGDFYLETEIGRLYHSSLDEQTLAAIKQ